MAVRKEATMNKAQDRTLWVRLGDYIERSANNSELKYGEEYIEGVNSNGEFCKTRANLTGINLKPYKLVNNGDFVYNPARFNIGSIAYRTQGFCIVSHLYVVFRLTEYGRKYFEPKFLFLYIYRKEFFRLIDYLNFGSQRPEFNFFELSEIQVPLPSIEVQRELVAVYEGLKGLAEENEAMLQPLSEACHAFIADCKRKYPAATLGDYIEECDERNSNGRYGVDDVRGISTDKKLIDTKANLDGVSLSSYKVINPTEFVYVADTSRRGDKVALALNNETDSFLVSSIYTVFRSKDKEKLLPEYLFLLLSRSEFDRYARFNSWGSARETFDWAELCRMRIPLPDKDVQAQIVALYHCYDECKRIASEARDRLGTICPALIRYATEENAAKA